VSQFPIQFTKPPRRGEPFKVAPRPETPTTDHEETSWIPLLWVLAWYTGYMAGR
jgi:hypothetical protein